MHQNDHHHSCLVSNSTILVTLNHSLHVRSPQQKQQTNALTTQDHAQENWR